MSQYTQYVVSDVDPATANLDFNKIEKACGLFFDDNLRYKLKVSVVEYRNWKKTFQNIDAKKVQRYCQKIVKAVDVLLPFLSHLSTDKEGIEEYDPAVIGAVWNHTIPHDMRDKVSEGMMTVYLKKWRERAIEAQQIKGSTGQPSKIALRIFIRDLHPIFLAAGGTSRGYHYDDLHGGESGKFYNMVLAMLRQIDPDEATDSGIAKIIMRVIPVVQKSITDANS